MKIHTHNHPYTSLLTTLRSQLPYSGPLYRRIQHAVTHHSPTARVLATFPPDSPPDPEKPWLAAYADTHRGPDTQVWLFSSLETNSPSNPDSSKPSSSSSALSNQSDIQGNALGHFSTRSAEEKEIVKNQLLSLFTYIRTELVRAYLEWLSSKHTPAEEKKQGKEEGVKKIPPHPKASVLLGTVHIGLVTLVVELFSEKKLRIHRGQDVYYVKYCFPASSFSVPSQHLNDNDKRGGGEGYRFTDSTGNPGIQESHIELVNSRTHISRSKEALLAMGGVALYSTSSTTTSEGEGKGEMPVAWAFLGFDGSLCSLHVEVEHRGKGLGGLVGREVMKRGVDVFEPGSHFHSPSTDGAGSTGNSEEWFFADVAVDNTASRRVMEKMGAVVGWTVAWMVVEISF